MNRPNLTTTALLLLAVFAAAQMAPIASLASTAGRRNTAIGLTAGAVYAAVRGKKTAAIALGAGAAYAWKRHADERAHVAYKRGYARGYHRGYRTAKHHYVRHHKK